MKKRIRISILFGLVCALLLSMTHFDAVCDDLRENLLRLHIIANSDSAEDQQLKLKVRDEILAASEGMFFNADNLLAAEQEVEKRLSQFEKIVNAVIKENGFNYKSELCLGECFFETRHYDTFSLPAGNYRALVVRLGRAEGENWWCVIYPGVCIGAAGGNLRQSVRDESATVAQQSDRYIIRFKLVELYQRIKNWFC